MGNVIFKPGTRKGPVILLSEKPSAPPTITLPNGQVVTAEPANKHGGAFFNEGAYQYVFPSDILGQSGATLTVDGKTQKLGNTNMSYRGTDVGGLTESSKGAVGSTETGPGGSGPFGPATPGSVGKFGVAPAFIGNLFPDATVIPGAAKDYQYIDPIKFGQEFTPYARQQVADTYKQAAGFALDTLDTEFKGLLGYVSKSAELKRGETAQDNSFNQASRTGQLQSTIPDVLAGLSQQTADAQTYASGQAPNSVIDKGLELGVRSAAADTASASGFGVASSASRKISDLMSAQQRIGLSQYGNQLLQSNAQTRAGLELAPTEYSNVGSSINANPSISASQLQQSNANLINGNVAISASNAFANTTQQSQYISSLDQRTQEFNAGNLNNFALSKFSYLNSYVNSVAGAYQTDINTQVGIGQQNQAQNIAAQNQAQTQQNQFITNLLGAAGKFVGLYNAGSGASSIDTPTGTPPGSGIYG